MDQKKLDQQSQHWEKSFSNKPEMFGLEPSKAAKEAKKIFETQKVKTFFARKKINILELGAGLGRDTTYLVLNSETGLIHVTALDYSAQAIKIVNQKKEDCGKPYSDRITTKVWDVRNKLPFKDNSFDGCFSHMLYCMALSTSDLLNLNKEVCRVLKPGGINIYTVRHTGDGDFKNGIHVGEDLYKNDGFIVHFFSEEKVKKISKGFDIENINEFHEGKFPRKLFMVILRKK